MKMMFIKPVFVALIAGTLLQGCAGASSSTAKVDAAAQLDTQFMQSGFSRISQALTVAGEFIIPTDQVIDPVTGELVAGDPVTAPVVVADPVTPVIIADPLAPVIIADPAVPVISAPVASEPVTTNPVVVTPPVVEALPIVVLPPVTAPGSGGVCTSSDDSGDCDDEDTSVYCDAAFMAKHSKKGIKGYKYRVLNANGLKFENTRGKLIIVGTSKFNFLHEINGHRGKLVLCGLRVREIKHTRGNIRLHNTFVDSLIRHIGHLELDETSRVSRVNLTSCSVNKK